MGMYVSNYFQNFLIIMYCSKWMKISKANIRKFDLKEEVLASQKSWSRLKIYWWEKVYEYLHT